MCSSWRSTIARAVSYAICASPHGGSRLAQSRKTQNTKHASLIRVGAMNQAIVLPRVHPPDRTPAICVEQRTARDESERIVERCNVFVRDLVVAGKNRLEISVRHVSDEVA